MNIHIVYTLFSALTLYSEPLDYPGDVGFDPLGLKPTDAKAFANMQTREIQNGRLAMLGVAGMCAQELVNHRTIFETIDFYTKINAGENPYAICGDSIVC